MAGEQNIENINLEKIPVPPSTSEKIKTPENKTETISAPNEKKADTKSTTNVFVGNDIVRAQVASSYQQKRAQEIDLILSEGLNEVFLKMIPDDQKKFQKKGEETVMKINELLSETKIKINKIISLIRKWLALVTGINKFFLEQEVKLKADRIMHLKDK